MLPMTIGRNYPGYNFFLAEIKKHYNPKTKIKNYSQKRDQTQ